MKPIAHILGTCCAALLLHACQTVVEVELPERESKLALNGLFSQDSVIVFTLSASKGILEPGSLEYITNGRIEVSGSDGSHEIITGTGSEPQKDVPYLYVSTIKPRANVSYTAKASAAGYPSVSATDVLPPVITIDRVDTATTYSFETIQKEVGITFTDPAGTANFYEVKLFYLILGPETDSTGQPVPHTGVIPSYVATEGIFEGGANEQIFTDELFNGKSFTVKLTFDEHFITGEWSDTIAFPFPVFLIAELRSASENYYRFYSSYLNYQYSSGDPFAQPVQVYTNINGGFGIFAGFSIARDTLQVN